METKHLLKLAALNLALTTMFAAALPPPNTYIQSSEGSVAANAPMITNTSNVKAIEKMEQNAKHREIIATLRKIEEGAKKGDVDQLKKRAALVASFQEEEIFSIIIADAEQELGDELVEIAQKLREVANTPVQGAEVAPLAVGNRVHQ